MFFKIEKQEEEASYTPAPTPTATAPAKSSSAKGSFDFQKYKMFILRAFCIFLVIENPFEAKRALLKSNNQVAAILWIYDICL